MACLDLNIMSSNTWFWQANSWILRLGPRVLWDHWFYSRPRASRSWCKNSFFVFFFYLTNSLFSHLLIRLTDCLAVYHTEYQKKHILFSQHKKSRKTQTPTKQCQLCKKWNNNPITPNYFRTRRQFKLQGVPQYCVHFCFLNFSAS